VGLARSVHIQFLRIPCILELNYQEIDWKFHLRQVDSVVWKLETKGFINV
jgi:hypothetical protein